MKNKISSQIAFNKILGENNFNFMSTFEGFKICFYLATFVLLKSPTLAIFAYFMLYLHLLVVRFSLNRSRIKDFNTNFYGFYFTYTLPKEFLLTGKFVLCYLLGLLTKTDTSYLILGNSIADLLIDLFKSHSYYNKFWVKKSFDEINFGSKFEDEKFVNLEIYLKELYDLINKTNKIYIEKN